MQLSWLIRGKKPVLTAIFAVLVLLLAPGCSKESDDTRVYLQTEWTGDGRNLAQAEEELKDHGILWVRLYQPDGEVRFTYDENYFKSYKANSTVTEPGSDQLTSQATQELIQLLDQFIQVSDTYLRKYASSPFLVDPQIDGAPLERHEISQEDIDVIQGRLDAAHAVKDRLINESL